MKKTAGYILLALLFSVSAGFCQNENSKWYFGSYAGLNFMTSPPSVILGSGMSVLEGCSSVADAAGNLLFYTDGMWVYNQLNTVMTGATMYGGNTPVQSCVILKKPGSATLYYIFTVEGMGSPLGINYSVVDMSLAAGLGSVTVLNAPVYNSSCLEEIIATRHCNGVDSWIVVRESGNSANFRAYLLTPAGVNPVPVVSNVGINTNGYTGYLNFSPNGRKLAESHAGIIRLFDFDNTTGLVSNPISLSTSQFYTTCEFSPDGTKLYADQSLNNEIHQWDLCTVPAIAASLYTVQAPRPGDMQRAPDGKIYIAEVNSVPSGTLGVINNPNVAGAGCNFNINGLVILPGTTVESLPNLTDFYLQAPVLPSFTYTANPLYGCYTASYTAPSELQDYPIGGCLKGSGLLKSMTWNFGDPGSGVANTSTLTNPSHIYPGMGTYTTLLILDYGCGGGIDTLYQQVAITMPCVSVNSTSITCANLGSATVSTTGGIGPYSYTWMPTGQTGPVATGLSPGTYTISLKDLGSNSIYTLTTTFVPLIPLTGTVVSSYTMDCPNTGTATVLVSNGSGNQSYNWTNGLMSYTVATPNNLGPGNWAVTATDLLTGCQFTQTLSMTSLYPPPLLTASGSTVCIGQNISLNATSNGTAVVWAGPLGFSSAALNLSIANASLTQSGGYTITTTSAQSCTNAVMANVSVLPPPSLTVSLSSNSLCAQALNGSPNTITLTSGGAATYTLTTPAYIDNPNPNGPVSSLSSLPPFQPGVSTATLVGSNGACTATTIATFTIVPNPTLTVNSPTPVICAGQSFTYTSQGASSYTWGAGSPGLSTYTAPITIANPSVTTIYSVAGGSLGCNSGTETLMLTVNPIPVFSISPASLCAGSATVLTINGPAISYSWVPFNTLNASTGQTVIATPPGSQTYSVIGTLNGCNGTVMVNVNVWPLPVVSASTSKNVLCLNDTFLLRGFGASAYYWNGPNYWSSQQQQVQVVAANSSFAGTYTLIGEGDYGCKSSAQIFIQLNDLPTGKLTGIKEGCAPFCSDLHFLPETVSTGASWQYNYQSVYGNSFSFCFNEAGQHVITGRFYDTLTGCRQEVDFQIIAHARPAADFVFAPEQPIEGIDPVIFTNTSTGEQLNNWSWYIKDNTTHPVFTPNMSYLFENRGSYAVAMVVKNKWGCADSIVKIIEVGSDYSIYIPNAFTPNNDARNDVFMPVGYGIKAYYLEIFDRWGERVFGSNELLPGWDGSFKGQPCKEDVYAWKLSVTSLKGEHKQLSGHVTLYR